MHHTHLPTPSHPLAAVGWASHALAWLSVAVVSWAETAAERQHRKRQAAAAAALERRRAEERRRQEEQQQRDREAEKLRRLQLAAASGKPAAASGLRQRGSGGRPKLESMLSWQSEMLARIEREEEVPASGRRSPGLGAAALPPAAAAGPGDRPLGSGSGGGSAEAAAQLSSRSAGELSDRADSALLPPASPGAAAGEGGGSGGGEGKGGAVEEEEAPSVGGGIWGLVSSLDLSYLAEHVQVG